MCGAKCDIQKEFIKVSPDRNSCLLKPFYAREPL